MAALYWGQLTVSEDTGSVSDWLLQGVNAGVAQTDRQ